MVFEVFLWAMLFTEAGKWVCEKVFRARENTGARVAVCIEVWGVAK